MKKSHTPRGFSHIEFTDYYDKPCSIQESSLTNESCIWLGLDKADPHIKVSDAIELGLVDSSTSPIGWIPYPVPNEVLLSTRMHLSQAQVKELLPILQKFVDTGEI